MLTNERIREMWESYNPMHGIESFARAIESEARPDALEEAAKVCDRLAAGTLDAQQGPSETLSNVMLRQVAVLGHGECANAIRALKETIQ